MSRYSQRGSNFIFFVAFTLPLTLFSLTLAADFSGIVLASRKAQTVADAAARAAGTAIDPTTGLFRMTAEGKPAEPECGEDCTTLDLAQQMYDVSVSRSTVTLAKCDKQVEVSQGAAELTVTIPYSVTNLSLLGAFVGKNYGGFKCLSSVAKVRICGADDDGCLYPGAN